MPFFSLQQSASPEAISSYSEVSFVVCFLLGKINLNEVELHGSLLIVGAFA